jgi:hypothetical protein
MNIHSLFRWSTAERLAAAGGIANARGGRRGMPEIKNVLDILPRDLRAEVIADANAALAAVDMLQPVDNPLIDGIIFCLDRASPLPWHAPADAHEVRDAGDKEILSLPADDNRALITVGLNALPRLLTIIERQARWISDLQAGTFINCVYCGHRYGPSATTPVAMADVLKAHIAECPEHPMSKLVAAARPLLEACEDDFISTDTELGEHRCADDEPVAKGDLGPDDESSVTFGMIRALRAAMPAEPSA